MEKKDDINPISFLIDNVKPEDFVNWKIKHWEALTRLIIQNYGVEFVYSNTDRIIEEIANEQWNSLEIPTEKKLVKNIVYVNSLGKKIKEKLKITDIAKSYGLELKGYKCVCPFHLDTDPSLSLSDEKGCFYCFGCGVKGDIIEFVRKMEEIKNGKK